MGKATAAKASVAASKTLRDGHGAKSPKSLAGSALTQRAMSKPASLSSSDADRAVKRYLSKLAG